MNHILWTPGTHKKISFILVRGYPLTVEIFCSVGGLPVLGLHVLAENEGKSIVSHLIFGIIKAYVSILSKTSVKLQSWFKQTKELERKTKCSVSKKTYLALVRIDIHMHSKAIKLSQKQHNNRSLGTPCFQAFFELHFRRKKACGAYSHQLYF